MRATSKPAGERAYSLRERWLTNVSVPTSSDLSPVDVIIERGIRPLGDPETSGPSHDEGLSGALDPARGPPV